MRTLQLTDAEYAFVKRAVEQVNDIENDMALDCIDLHPQEDQPIIVNREKAKALRDEIEETMNRQVVRIQLLTKLGIRVNEAGYIAC